MVIKVVDNLTQLKNVKIGKAIGNRFSIISGLNNGDIVVIRGNEGLRNGQRVSFEY